MNFGARTARQVSVATATAGTCRQGQIWKASSWT
ncbi:hypothetical protein ABH931_004145 [Streptacidiphilus sp. MAP12-33]